MRGREKGHRPRHAMQGGGEIRGGTAVDAIARACLCSHLFESLEAGALHRVIGVDIFRATAQMAVERQETRMLARAVVVDLAGRLPCADQRVTRRQVGRFLRSAAKIIDGTSDMIKPALHTVRMDGRPLMAGAGKGKVFGPQPRRIRRTAGDQRQGLQHLRGRARHDHRLRITPCLDDPTRGIADHGMPMVDAFQEGAAPDLGHGNGGGH